MEPEHLHTNSWLLENLDTYINEDQISGSIIRLNNEINRIELISGQSRRTNKMRIEIEKLGDLLAYSRNQANIRTQHFHMTNSISKEEWRLPEFPGQRDNIFGS